MRNCHGKAALLLGFGLLVSACSGDTTTPFPTGPGTTGGALSTTPYGTSAAQGGGFVAQGGAVVGQGGAVVGQGGAVVGQGGAVVGQGGAVVGQGGAVVGQGGAVVGQGGAVVGQGGSKATTGGTVATTGGTKATGGTTGAAVGGTKATGGGTSTAPQNLFTVGPYTGAGWVAGGTVDGTTTGTPLTTFTNPTVSGTTQTFASLTNVCMSASIPALQACTATGVTCSAEEKAAAGGKNYSENWGALLGLNTTTTEGTPKGNTFTSIAVTYTGTVTPATTQVRLQVQLKDGSTYCNNGYPSGLAVTVAELTKNCYQAGGTALTTAQTANITSIQLLVSAGSTAETVSNLCLTNIVLDGSTGGGTSTTCTDTASGSGTLTGQYAYATLPTSSGSKSYVLHTNWWGIYASETVPYSGLSFSVAGLTGNMQGATAANPVGYPSLFIGTYAGRSSAGSNLPKQVSALTTIPTIFQWSGGGDTSQYNAAYDVWFTTSTAAAGSSPGAGGAYLMVWMFLPSDKRPRGTMVNASVAIPGAAGSWQVWYDSTNPPCVSYVANAQQASLTFDLNEFIKNAKTNNWGITNSQYLSIVFGGFEIWNGSAATHNGLKLDKFCAQVN